MIGYFKCPFCGLMCLAGSVDEGDFLTHKPPTCTRYNQVKTADDAAEFMREARLKLEPKGTN